LVSKDMVIKDVINKYPGAVKVFMKHGLRCVGWGGALFETVEQGARAHGINLDLLMEDLNKLSESN